MSVHEDSQSTQLFTATASTGYAIGQETSHSIPCSYVESIQQSSEEFSCSLGILFLDLPIYFIIELI